MLANLFNSDSPQYMMFGLFIASLFITFAACYLSFTADKTQKDDTMPEIAIAAIIGIIAAVMITFGVEDIMKDRETAGDLIELEAELAQHYPGADISAYEGVDDPEKSQFVGEQLVIIVYDNDRVQGDLCTLIMLDMLEDGSIDVYRAEDGVTIGDTPFINAHSFDMAKAGSYC